MKKGVFTFSYKQISFCLLFFSWMNVFLTYGQNEFSPKREFRGSWIQCVNGQFQGLNAIQMQAKLIKQLDAMQSCKMNVVFFQVRAEFDALYPSKYEPWSRFLTGKQGQNPGWDPLSWMIEQCHKRGMELHAWINPFRAKTSGTKDLSILHPYLLHSERFFAYDNLLIADPALPENRNYICDIVKDIVSRYDVDGLHIDDYFYPYPKPGLIIPDDGSFQRYKNGIKDKKDWRRYNVNLFIEQLYQTIRNTKPWVKFSVSPFGIYHNTKSGWQVPGSNTAGLQNYDDLYADVLFWINKGWVDYVVPQIYWEIGHPTADYDTLIKWWASFAKNRPLVIGQDIERSLKARDIHNPSKNQIPAKFNLQRFLNGVSGSALWYAGALANDPDLIYYLSHTYYQHPALLPAMSFIDSKAPKKVSQLKDIWTQDGYFLFWTPPKSKDPLQEVRNFAVYAFPKGVKVDVNNANYLVEITPQNYYAIPYYFGMEKYTYVVTALDRLQNESKPKKIKIKR